MSLLYAAKRHRFSCAWRAAVCVALATFFFYNPFLSALEQHANLTVCHPARHRATIGCSELEQFAQPSSLAVPLPEVDVSKVSPEIASALPTGTMHQVVREEGAPAQTGFSVSLWFRPPPAV